MNRKLAQRNPVNIALAFAARYLSLLARARPRFNVVRAQEPAPAPHVVAKLASLKTVPVPSLATSRHLSKIGTRRFALGKALFWDTAIGSDGQACASCHFHAGADSRSKNQLNPPSALFPRIRLFLSSARMAVAPTIS